MSNETHLMNLRSNSLRGSVVAACVAAGVAWTATANPLSGPDAAPHVITLELPSLEQVMAAEPAEHTEIARRLAERFIDKYSGSATAIETIRIGNAPLAFGQLDEKSSHYIRQISPNAPADAYEKRLAGILGSTVQFVKLRVPDTSVAIYGLPVEAHAARPATDVNANYADVINLLDAFVTSKSSITTGQVADSRELMRGVDEALRLADGRPVFARQNGFWIDVCSDHRRLAMVAAAALQRGSDKPAPASRQRSNSQRSMNAPGVSTTRDRASTTSASPQQVSSSTARTVSRFSRASRVPESGDTRTTAPTETVVLANAPERSEPLRTETTNQIERSGTTDSDAPIALGARGGPDMSGECFKSNEPPVANGDIYATDYATELRVGRPGVLGNDSDPDGNPLKAELATDVANGTLTFRKNGAFIYTPNEGFSGVDEFAYRALDGYGEQSSLTRVSIGVGADNGGGDPGPYILPGSGWTGPTAQPDPVGNPGDPGYDAKAIARWDVVPFQTFDGEFNIGVVAFHMNGIDRVDFAVDGGDWVSVEEMALNERTGVWEYWATLNAADFDDGQIEVRAIAWPEGAGEPRVLAGEYTVESANSGNQSLFLSTNASGSLPTDIRWVSPNGSNTNDGLSADRPMRSILAAAQRIDREVGSADGGTIYLVEGDHHLAGDGLGGAFPKTSDRWLTITHAPGLMRDQVRIYHNTSSYLDTSRTRLLDVTVTSGLMVTTRPDPEPAIWFDQTALTTGHRLVRTNFQHGYDSGGVFATDCLVHDTMDGLKPHLVRGTHVDTIGQIGFRGPRLLVNCTLDYISREGWEDYHNQPPHPDVVWWQAAAPFENRIIYGLHATNADAQGIFMKTGDASMSASNFAVVNAIVESTLNNPWHNIGADHLLFWHVTFTDDLLFQDDGGFFNNGDDLRNVSIRNSVFEGIGEAGFVGLDEHVLIDNNHFIVDAPRGTNATQGDPHWVNGAGDDFRPSTHSVLAERVAEISVPIDQAGVDLNAPAGIGSLQPIE